jgi:hypothetical protein
MPAHLNTKDASVMKCPYWSASLRLVRSPRRFSCKTGCFSFKNWLRYCYVHRLLGLKDHLASRIFRLRLYHDPLLGRRDYPHHRVASNQSPAKDLVKKEKALSKLKNPSEMVDGSFTNGMTDVKRADTQ